MEGFKVNDLHGVEPYRSICLVVRYFAKSDLFYSQGWKKIGGVPQGTSSKFSLSLFVALSQKMISKSSLISLWLPPSN